MKIIQCILVPVLGLILLYACKDEVADKRNWPEHPGKGVLVFLDNNSVYIRTSPQHNANTISMDSLQQLRTYSDSLFHVHIDTLSSLLTLDSVFNALRASGVIMLELSLQGDSVAIPMQSKPDSDTTTQYNTINVALFGNAQNKVYAACSGEDIEEFLGYPVLLIDLSSSSNLYKGLQSLKNYAAQYANAQDLIDKTGFWVSDTRAFTNAGFADSLLQNFQGPNTTGESIRVFLKHSMTPQQGFTLLKTANELYKKIELVFLP
jgi:hypothetical protein